MVFTLILVIQAKRVTQSLVYHGFYTNFSILTKTSDTVFGLEWVLH